MMDYSVVDNEIDFMFLEKAWKEIELSSLNIDVSISFQWCLAWWKIFRERENNTFGYNKKLFILVGRNNGNIETIIPLIYLERKFSVLKIRFVEFLGQQWGATTFSILTKNIAEFDWNVLMSFLRKNVSFDILYLRNISSLNNQVFENCLIINAGCPQVTLGKLGDYSTYYTSLPKQLKQNIRTAFNRAKKLEVELISDIRQEAEISWEDIIEISESKKNDNKYSLYDDPLKRNFYELINDLYDTNFSIVCLNKKIVAYRYNILYGNIKFCIDASYDRSYPQYNLGAISVLKNIEDSYCKGKLLHSMGPGCYDYKMKFTSEINYIGYVLESGKGVKSRIVKLLFSFYLKKYAKKQL